MHHTNDKEFRMSEIHDDPIIIFTDGACSGNPGPGGWGVTLQRGKRSRELKGGEPETTNNRMELVAAIEALSALRKAPLPVRLFTDSQYVKNGITIWLPTWKTNGWKTSNRKPVKNADLWLRLEELAKKHHVEWKWVEGHSGIEGNERADELARQGMKPFLSVPCCA